MCNFSSFIFIFLFSYHKSQCIQLEGKHKTAIAIELMKLGIAKKELKETSNHKDYPKFTKFKYKNENRDLDLQILKFSLKDRVLKNNFEFRKSFFFNPDFSFMFPYDKHCFEGKKWGILVFIKKSEFIDLHTCARKKNFKVSDVKIYLRNLVNFFIKLEAAKIKVIRFGHAKLVCNPHDYTMPLIVDFNIFYKFNDSMYRHYYKNKLKGGTSNWSKNILDLYTGSELDNISNSIEISDTPPIVLNAYSFLYSLKKACISMTLFNHSLFDKSFFSLLKNLDKYIKSFENSKMGILSSEEMKTIYDYLGVYNQVSNEHFAINTREKRSDLESHLNPETSNENMFDYSAPPPPYSPHRIYPTLT